MNGQSYKLNLSTGLSNSKNKILFINPLSHSPLVLFSVTKYKFPPNKNGNILVLCIYLEREREKKRTIFQNFVLKSANINLYLPNEPKSKNKY